MNTYGYCRVSTLRQADEGESPVATALGDELGAWIRRHAGARMDLARLICEAAASLSDPSKSAWREQARADLAKLAEIEIKLAETEAKLDALRAKHLATNSALLLALTALATEQQRRRLLERVSQTKQDQRERGRYLGGITPWGFRVGTDGALEPVDGALDAIEAMHRMRSEGASLRAIAAAMRDRGHELSHEAVRRVLAREAVTCGDVA